MGVFLPKRVLICASILAVIVLFISCSIGGNSPGNYQDGIQISAALEELDSLEKPVGVDEKVFEELKALLRDKLLELWGENARFAAKAPLGDAGRVTDLAYSSGTGELDWSYVNVGDYDVSGEVGIPDITPIALNYLALTNDGVGDDAYESWIDGDKSGEIGIADVTPIALGYMNSVFAYEILTSASENGNYLAIGSVNFPSPPQFPVTFTSAVPPGNLGWIRVRPMDASGSPGEPSNAVAVPASNLPPDAQFNYEQQPGGFIVNFDASASSDPDGVIVRYEWDWTSDGTYDYDGGGSHLATHDYAVQGQFECTLRVTDDGVESGTFTRTVYVVELATDWTLVDPFPGEPNYRMPSLAYIGDGVTGFPAIAFYNGEFDSAFAGATDGYGAGWGTVTLIDTYLIQSMTLADIGGYPAIAYNDYNTDELFFVKALDTLGTTWGPHVSVDSTGGAGRPYPTMLEVAGLPALAYANNMNGDIYYVRASNADGDEWEAPIVLHGPPNPSVTYPSMAIVQGNPAVAFVNNSPVNVKYIRSGDALGDSWGTSMDVWSDGEANAWCSILTLDYGAFGNRPAVVNGAFQLDTIRIHRALDATGTAWESPIEIRRDSGAGFSHISAAVINGYPCVAYQDYNLASSDRSLVFQQALDPAGTYWSPPVYIVIDDAPEYITLIDVRGRPAIAYYKNSSPSGIRYAFSAP